MRVEILNEKTNKKQTKNKNESKENLETTLQ